MRARPFDNTRNLVRNTLGSTDGSFSLGVEPAQSTRLPRKKPATKRSPDIELARLDTLPPDTMVHVNGSGAIKQVDYRRAPEARKELPPEQHITPHPNLIKQLPKRTINGR